MNDTVTGIRFIPISNPSGSHIGFATFTYNGSIEIKDAAVHKKLKGGYRLVYPRNKEAGHDIVRPINKVAQEEIDRAITEHLDLLGKMISLRRQGGEVI